MPRATAPTPPPHEWELVGRSREVAAVDAFLADESRFPAALRLVGEPGIGKSTIWNRAVARAEELGFIVLRARPEQSERSLAFAALGDLLDEAYPQVRAKLPVPQRRALAAALLLDDVAADPEPRTLGVATLSAIRALAERQPVLLAIDDEQWLDRASAQVLGFVARRLVAESVGMVFAARATSTDIARVSALTVEGLSESDARALLDSVLTGPLDSKVRDRILAGTNGNPLALLELPRALSSTT
jgi:predicted ATPase